MTQVLVAERNAAKTVLTAATQAFKDAVARKENEHPDFLDWLGLIATTVAAVGADIAGVGKITGTLPSQSSADVMKQECRCCSATGHGINASQLAISVAGDFDKVIPGFSAAEPKRPRGAQAISGICGSTTFVGTAAVRPSPLWV